MKISYNWLKEFAAIDSYTPQYIAEVLLSIGFEVAEVLKPNLLSNNIVTAEILSIDRHPNADRLTLCKVTDGRQEYSIVCGAKNMSVGDHVALALPGTVLPGGIEIKKTSIRNVESHGMMCSERELEFSEEASGIIILPRDTVPGKTINEALYLDDVIFDIEVYPNRSDCLGIIGIARELSAKLDARFKLPEMFIIGKTDDEVFPVEVLEGDLCPVYTAALVKGVEVKDAPLLIKTRLKNCGLRPINNIVDITNYVMLETGHPLHAFDLDKLSGNKIVVRRANENEKITGLNDLDYPLDKDMLVIADGELPCAIAGVIGGRNSGVTSATKDIVIESAVFDRRSIRKTRKKINLITDSSYRFERGSAWETCDYGSRRSISLILQYANARFVSRHDVLNTDKTKLKKIKLRFDRLNRVLDMKLEKKEIADILVKLGMQIELHESDLMVEVPSYRLDINDEIDIIEDIARIKGYDAIPARLSAGNLPEYTIENKILSLNGICRKFLLGQGFYEAVNYSFTKWDKNLLNEFGKELVEIENPLTAETQYLKPSLLTGLAGNVARNLNNQFTNIKFFELGKIFHNEGPESRESDALGIICTGNINETNWKSPAEKVDFYFIYGIIQKLLSDELCCGKLDMKSQDKALGNIFIEGRSAAIRNDERQLCAVFGLLNPKFCDGIMQEIYYAEVYLENLVETQDKVFKPYINLPFSKRDIAILVPKDTEYSLIQKKIMSYASNNLELNLELFDVYQGGKIPEDKKSLCFTIYLKHREHTLSDDEINKKIDEILKGLAKFGATLRTV